MPGTPLDKVQQMADCLPPLDQMRLIQHLSPRLSKALITQLLPDSEEKIENSEAWKILFEIGESLAATDSQESPTLTQTLLSMRR